MRPRQKLLLLWGKALYPPNTVEDCHKGTWLMEIINDEIIWTEVIIVYHKAYPFINLEIVGSLNSTALYFKGYNYF